MHEELRALTLPKLCLRLTQLHLLLPQYHCVHTTNIKLSSLSLVLTGGSPEESCKKAERVLKTVQGWSDDEVPNKNELIGNLYSCIGNAQLEMGQMEAALKSHQMHLELARQK